MREREWGEYIGHIKARERWKNYYLKKYRRNTFPQSVGFNSNSYPSMNMSVWENREREREWRERWVTKEREREREKTRV